MRALRGAWSQRYRKPSEKRGYSQLWRPSDLLGGGDWEELPGIVPTSWCTLILHSKNSPFDIFNHLVDRNCLAQVGGRPSHLGGGDKERTVFTSTTERGARLAQQGAVHFSTTASLSALYLAIRERCLKSSLPQAHHLHYQTIKLPSPEPLLYTY